MGCNCAKKWTPANAPPITCRFAEATERRWNGGESFVYLCHTVGMVASGQFRTHGVPTTEVNSRCCNADKCVLFEPIEDNCRYAEPTKTLWSPKRSDCYVVHCRYRGPFDEDTPAFAYARKATSGDTLRRPDGEINTEFIAEADYINVRSCFCTLEKCSHFIPKG